MTPTAKSLSEQLRAMDWQDIHTAPRDGTKVLCFSPGNKAATYAEPRYPHFTVDEYRGEGRSGFYKMWPEAPYTHWMPLPVVPSESSLLSLAASALEDAERERNELRAKLAEAVKAILSHFEKMQRMASMWLAPDTYIASFPKSDNAFDAVFGVPEKLHSDEARRKISKRRDDAFISDIIRMLDGPEQREAENAIRSLFVPSPTPLQEQNANSGKEKG